MKRTIVHVAGTIVLCLIIVGTIVFLAVMNAGLESDLSTANATITERDRAIVEKVGEIADLKRRIAVLEADATATTESLPGKIKEGIKEGIEEAVSDRTKDLLADLEEVRADLAAKDAEIKGIRAEAGAEIMRLGGELGAEKVYAAAKREEMLSELGRASAIIGAVIPALIELIDEGYRLVVTTPVGVEADVVSFDGAIFVHYSTCPFDSGSILAERECGPEGFVASFSPRPPEGQGTKDEGGYKETLRGGF